MSQDFRIKEYRFTPVTYNATTTTSYYTDHPINGEILELEWKTSLTGSFSLTKSGTGITIWSNNATSGASWQSAIPRQFGQLPTGSIATASLVPFNVNEPLALNVGSVLSGTTMTLTGFVVKYR